MKHIPALDGVRALAIFLVIAFHTYVPFFQGGWVGVDIFFVLSGFLITSLLLDEMKETGRIAFLRFYIRRALRLFPALLVMLALVLGYEHFFGKEQHYREIVSALLYLMDYAMAFDYVQLITPLSHTWTLAVEEHYYLVWPPLLFWLGRRYPDKRLVKVIAVITAVSFGWMLLCTLFTTEWHTVSARFDAHMGGLLLGSLLAAMRFHGVKIPMARDGLVISALVLGYWVACVPHGLAYYRISVVAVILADIFTFFLLAKLMDDREWIVSKWLGAAVPAFIGRISYGLYIYHKLPYSIWREGKTLDDCHDLWPQEFAVTAGTAAILALASYYTVELLARHAGKKWRSGSIVR